MKIHVQTAKVVSDSTQRSGNTAEKATVIERNLILDNQLPPLFSDVFWGIHTCNTSLILPHTSAVHSVCC